MVVHTLNDQPLFLGIDGGGTKTIMVIINENKDIIHRDVGGTININGTDVHKASENLRKLLIRLPYRNNIVAGCLGIAGISNKHTQSFLDEAKRDGVFPCNIDIVGDHVIALIGALTDNQGILLISGTGSICVGKSRTGEILRTGGMGHLIDDLGSGYSIGRDILSAVVKMHDGRIEKTPLYHDVFNYLGITTVEELVEFVYHPKREKKDIADIAKLLPKSYEREEQIGIDIKNRAASDLLSLCKPLIRKMKINQGVIALSGGILHNDKELRKTFEALVQKDLQGFKCINPKMDAAFGAALMARDSTRPRLTPL